jgi:hypothetical protein
VGQISLPQGISYLNAAEQDETKVIDSLTLEQYHEICFWNLSQIRTVAIYTDATVNPGALLVCSSDDQVNEWRAVYLLSGTGFFTIKLLSKFQLW